MEVCFQKHVTYFKAEKKNKEWGGRGERKREMEREGLERNRRERRRKAGGRGKQEEGGGRRKGA